MSILSLSMSGVLPRAGVTPRRVATRNTTTTSTAGAAAEVRGSSVPSPTAPRGGKTTRSTVVKSLANHGSSVGTTATTAAAAFGGVKGGAKRGAAVVAAAAAAAESTGGGGGGGPKINLPTAITIVRVVAVPVVTALFYYPAAWVSPVICFVFILAAITDWLDGYLARKMNLVSSFGAFLDPVADKLMVAAALVLLCTIAPQNVQPWAVAVPATVIVGREITMSAIREWAAAAGGEAHSAVAVNSYGKWKTATQLVALSVLLGVRDGTAWLGLDPAGAAAGWLTQGGVCCLWASAGLALLSLWIYMAGVIKFMD